MVPKWNGKWCTIANREPETELNIGGIDREGNGDNVKNKQIKNLLRYAEWQAGPNMQDSWHNINLKATSLLEHTGTNYKTKLRWGQNLKNIKLKRKTNETKGCKAEDKEHDTKSWQTKKK